MLYRVDQKVMLCVNLKDLCTKAILSIVYYLEIMLDLGVRQSMKIGSFMGAKI
jgi:hypothetical protein